MFRKRAGRLTRRQEILKRNATDRFYATAFDKEPRFQQEVPPERASRKPSGKPLERDVLKAVLHALKHDPRVARVERQQSGVFREGNRFIRVGTRGALDIKGMLVGGRAFEIEVKVPGRKPDERQAERIAAIRANGGIAGYCWSVESALALLP